MGDSAEARAAAARGDGLDADAVRQRSLRCQACVVAPAEPEAMSICTTALRRSTSFAVVSLRWGWSGRIRAMTTLADDLVSDELWALVRPCSRFHRGRPVAAGTAPSPTGPAWPRSCTWRGPPPPGGCCPRELGCGSPATCRRRLTEWANAGVFDAPHLQVLDRLSQRGQLDWSQASVDAMSVRAKRGATWAQIQSIVASLEASSTWSAVVRVCAGGLCAGVLQPALISQKELTQSALLRRPRAGVAA
jgi:hypothetical protein